VSKERRLGRGLEALLGRAGLEPAPATQGTAALAAQPARPTPPPGLGTGAARLILHAPEEVEQAAATLPTSDVSPTAIDPNPWQPRTVVDDADLAELADSLRAHGLVQPIVVRARGDRYQLIAGQRRLAAARRLGWTKVPVRVLDVDDRQMSEIAIVENLQRRDLDALEQQAVDALVPALTESRDKFLCPRGWSALACSDRGEGTRPSHVARYRRCHPFLGRIAAPTGRRVPGYRSRSARPWFHRSAGRQRALAQRHGRGGG
jgi:hypothetical protein